MDGRPLVWTRKGYWRARRPDATYVEHKNSINFTSAEEVYEAIASDPAKGKFTVEPARYEVSKAYGTLPSTAPPETPTGLLAQVTSATAVLLTWNAQADATSYQVWRDGTPIGSASGTSYSVTGLTPSTQYAFTITAVSVIGVHSAQTSPAVVTTFANTQPAWSVVPTQNLLVGQSYNMNLLSVCSDVDGDPITFGIVAGTLPTGLSLAGSVVSGTATAAGAPSVTFSASDGIAPASTRVINYSVVALDTTPPAVPGTITVVGVTPGTVSLSWPANAEPDFSYYRLQRSLDNTNWGLLASPTSASYVDTAVSASTTYYYRLAAVDTTGNASAYGSSVQATTSSPPYTVSAVVQLYDSQNVLAGYGPARDPAGVFFGRTDLAQGDKWRWSSVPAGVTAQELPGGGYSVSGPTGTHNLQWSLLHFASGTEEGGSKNVTLTDSYLSVNVAALAPSVPISLTTEGTLDWVHWGLTTSSSVNRKNVTQILGSMSPVNAITGRFADIDTWPVLSWTDGTPTTSQAGFTGGLYFEGVGNGATLTVPITDVTRQLKVHLGGFQSRCTLSVTFSDGTVAPYSSYVEVLGGQFDRTATIDFRGTPGTTMTVRWVLTSFVSYGNAALQAAALRLP